MGLGLLGWVIFILALCISIMVHETGHFVTAKRFGMKATKYFLGFGPTIWSTTRGETEYGIKALLVGGFVKIVGMHSLDDLDDPDDEPRSFRAKPAWQRLVVMVAGVLMNFVLAFVLLVVMFLAIGAVNDNTTQLGLVSPCVAANVTDLSNGVCGSSSQASPAKLAGLRVGDTITAFDGKAVSNWTQLGAEIKAAKPGTEVSITVLRGGKPVTLRTTVAQVSGREGGYMGIEPAVAFQPAGFAGAIDQTGSFFGQVITGTGKAFGNLPSAASKMFSPQRSASSGGQLCSVICAGEQTSQAVSADTGWRSKVEVVIVITAELNILLGLANLLPLMPLDGGLAAVVTWESIRSRFARWRGRPDPGLVDIRKVVPVMFSIFAMFAVFIAVVMLADIVNPLKLGG
jgi:membrane-associated protease RseP (regulator of RpoE activity)